MICEFFGECFVVELYQVVLCFVQWLVELVVYEFLVCMYVFEQFQCLLDVIFEQFCVWDFVCVVGFVEWQVVVVEECFECVDQLQFVFQ